MRTQILASLLAFGLAGCNAIFGITEGTLDDGSGGTASGGGGASQGGGGSSTQGGGGAGSGGTPATGGGGDGGGGAPPILCDPTQLSGGQAVDPSCGVFVDLEASASGSGTQASPFNDLEDALSSGNNPSEADVYICGSGSQTGLFVVPGGMSVYGGFACGAWTVDSGERPLLSGDLGEPGLVVQGSGSTTLSGFSVEGQPPPGGGAVAASAIGVFIKGGASPLDVLLRDMQIAAYDGETAPDADPFLTAASSGGNGQSASSTCMATGPVGGASGMCGAGFDTSGGRGSNCSTTMNANGLAGSGNPSGFGAGGIGGDCANASLQPQPGHNGQGGTAAVPSTLRGALTLAGFVPPITPMLSTNGEHGGGGGGGGSRPGNTGGGGGGGGCGGRGGETGRGGGASIAVAFAQPVGGGNLQIVASTLRAGRGGAGGAGAAGQAGGTGGSRGQGLASGLGCDGAVGGNGGAGGDGAGGPGGHGILVAYQSDVTIDVDAITFTDSMAGIGGAGGAGPVAALGGRPGMVCATAKFWNNPPNGVPEMQCFSANGNEI